MFKTIQTSSQAGIAMPICWTAAVPAAAVRTLPTMGGVSAAAAAAGTEGRPVAVASVRPYTHIVGDVFVLDGTFPGTSAWSPPI